MSPVDGRLGARHIAKVFVFPDSILCLGRGAATEASAPRNGRSNAFRENFFVAKNADISRAHRLLLARPSGTHFKKSSFAGPNVHVSRD